MMRFQLVSTQGLKYDGDAYEVLIPTAAGTIAVFEDHMPLISAARGGVVSVRVKQSDRDADTRAHAHGHLLRDFAHQRTALTRVERCSFCPRRALFHS